MNDEELVGVWATFQPTVYQRGRIDARVAAWLEARETSIVAEWLGLFRIAPFSAAGLVAVSALAVAIAPPFIWLVLALV
jgi:hypothetical protein